MSATSIEPLVPHEEWRPAILETLRQSGVVDPDYALHVERWLEQMSRSARVIGLAGSRAVASQHCRSVLQGSLKRSLAIPLLS